jgi:glycosyltransferase involved in cell wall biosynthesis
VRALHLVKTAEGASWAARQARVLGDLGIDVHVALPNLTGRAVSEWREAGATIHVLDCTLPIGAPHRLIGRTRQIRELVDGLAPALIHSHFVSTTLMARLALGRAHRIPRLFQVPGPLHLEHPLYRRAEIATAGPADAWIASSRYTRQLYRQASVPDGRIFLSYYGFDLPSLPREGNGRLRQQIGLRPEERIVGNINYMYPPKTYLGQRRGLKRHEDVIDALQRVCRTRPDVRGVLVGGQWGGGSGYEARLRERARRLTGDRVILPGRVSTDEALALWAGFDLAVHVPSSENCGGVVEPLAFGIPTIASRTGGLPEVVVDGVTGWLVPPAAPEVLADTILAALDDPVEGRQRAERGHHLVARMFDVERTGREVAAIYERTLDPGRPWPAEFDARHFLATGEGMGDDRGD